MSFQLTAFSLQLSVAKVNVSFAKKKVGSAQKNQSGYRCMLTAVSYKVVITMKFLTLTILFFLHTPLFAQLDSAIYEIEQHRKKQEQEFRDPEESPLHKKLRKKFTGLNYYPINLDYRVKATFVKTENPVLFKMKTTTARLPEYQKYGEVHFNLDGEQRVLEVYQSPETSAKPGLEDYLFIPFTDETNGIDTYDVGRYLDFRIPPSDQVILDFNKCYNPYCSYNAGYSCPIPPKVNHLPLKVEAGEKKYLPAVQH